MKLGHLRTVIYCIKALKNKMKSLLAFTLIFLAVSCEPQHVSKSSLVEKNAADSLSDYLASRIRYFSLPDSPNGADSNELFFYYAHQFDTSILIHFKKDKGIVHGIVYQVAPPYYQADSDFDDQQESPQFFEGFSFRVDSIQWTGIGKAADSILNIETGSEDASQPFDNPFYILAFSSKIRRNGNMKDQELLSGFFFYLKHAFIYPCLERKPKWKKIK
jgi:hypothetical protein